MEIDDDFIENLEVCRCIKDVFHISYRPISNEIAFEKGKYYQYFIEDEYSFWVYYDKDGGLGESGYRFVSDKVVDRSLTRSFKEHFIYGRFLKLKELEKIKYE